MWKIFRVFEEEVVGAVASLRVDADASQSLVPDNYKEDDPLPAPQKGDRYFFDEKEALAELHQRIYGRR